MQTSAVKKPIMVDMYEISCPLTMFDQMTTIKEVTDFVSNMCGYGIVYGVSTLSDVILVDRFAETSVVSTGSVVEASREIIQLRARILSLASNGTLDTVCVLPTFLSCSL